MANFNININNLRLKAFNNCKMTFNTETLVDSFYSAQNMEQLRKSAQQIRQGKIVTKTMEELETMESE